ncbi:U4/U6 small nuclear ribonucleoprotein Prp31 [Geodia barretti]|uniref:U4/U6 small nuclear ribonucleoprotein Prp31 n=1 Tax=Geodia barretti TaxID=519541 RepID=A0AA35S501_GEOBA|nr:U4/U6 small nuclear ribonucleoprotein Prp31 [Geodia barretti]
MVVSVTASTTQGQRIEQEELDCVMEACDMALILNEKKLKILGYVESRMSFIAPNVSAIVGSTVATKLMGTRCPKKDSGWFFISSNSSTHWIYFLFRPCSEHTTSPQHDIPRGIW